MNKMIMVLDTLSKLQSDTRLTTEEQRAMSMAWGYLFYMDVVTKKMAELEKGKNNIPQ